MPGDTRVPGGLLHIAMYRSCALKRADGQIFQWCFEPFMHVLAPRSHAHSIMTVDSIRLISSDTSLKISLIRTAPIWFDDPLAYAPPTRQTRFQAGGPGMHLAGWLTSAESSILTNTHNLWAALVSTALFIYPYPMYIVQSVSWCLGLHYYVTQSTGLRYQEAGNPSDLHLSTMPAKIEARVMATIHSTDDTCQNIPQGHGMS